jgi:hypothetical protein
MSPVRKEQLSGAAKLAAVVLVFSLGLWGCARKSGETAQGDRVRALEGRCVKLEQDYRTVIQARDKARRDLAALEEEAGRLQREAAAKEALLKERDALRKLAGQREQLVRQLSGERDDLKQQLTQRLTERDTVLGRYDRLRKGLQNLMNVDDTPPMPSAGGPTVPTAVPTVANPS